MNRRSFHLHRITSLVVLIAMLLSSTVNATVFELKNGMILDGVMGKLASYGDDPKKNNGGGEVAVELIVMVDDQLRRVFVSTYQVQNSRETEPTVSEHITIKQNVATNSKRVFQIGDSIGITPFNQWGRRIYSMQTAQGGIDIIQGITEITPHWTKVEGLMSDTPFTLDMRMRTSNIPASTLTKILKEQMDITDANQRLQIVRLYLQSERYKDAAKELSSVLKDFPDLSDLGKEVDALRQLSAKRLIDEIKFRKDKGQHSLSYAMLSKFPDQDIAAETLRNVQQMLEEYSKSDQLKQRLIDSLTKHMDAYANAANKPRVQASLDEINAELNSNTMNRLAPYLRLSDDPTLASEQKLSLAISGWILGSNDAVENLAISLSVRDVRDLVAEYISNRVEVDRTGILKKLEGMDGGSPEYLAKIIANMKPPLWDEAPEKQSDIPGYALIRAPGITGHNDFFYYVQLPQDYDPNRRYPTIVTLNGAGSTPEQQIDWWAGPYSQKSKLRMGQASRQGYIVIAPVWTEEHQFKYQYSGVEHASVLYSLRDACRKFSIDTDHVYLSGHSMGGDAAWDIGLAHPDLWAGVLPVVATADKYVARYWENARELPFYFVGGQYDGNKRELNTRDFDRYLTKANMDVTVVEYRGRGHEHFQDEIQEMFKWMNLHKRNFMKRDFKAMAMRPWDNFYYWVEVQNFPDRSIVLPSHWPAAKASAMTTEAKVLATNGVRVDSGAAKATIYLSPDIVDFSKRITVNFKGRNEGGEIVPSAETMLEDVRTRSDRQHPFWAKVTIDRGR
ncbi:MAG: carboxylesterase family protein [Pirellulales bacterium]